VQDRVRLVSFGHGQWIGKPNRKFEQELFQPRASSQPRAGGRGNVSRKLSERGGTHARTKSKLILTTLNNCFEDLLVSWSVGASW
jgi:hypothetical protein